MTYLQSKNRLTDNREQTYDCQEGGSVGEGRTESLELPDANYYIQDGQTARYLYVA